MKNYYKDFHTPEEYFLKHKVAPFEWRSINPNDVLKSAKKSSDKKEYHKKVSILTYQSVHKYI